MSSQFTKRLINVFPRSCLIVCSDSYHISLIRKLNCALTNPFILLYIYRRSPTIHCTQKTKYASRVRLNDKRGPFHMFQITDWQLLIRLHRCCEAFVFDGGIKYLLVCVHGFSHWPKTFPLPNQSAETDSRALWAHWIRCWYRSFITSCSRC